MAGRQECFRQGRDSYWSDTGTGPEGPARRLIDSHCHLGDPAYDPDRAEVVERASAAGVQRIVVIGESPASAERARQLAAADARLAATAGIHPHIAAEWNTEAAAWLRLALTDPLVVAAGEMGLDYHYDHSPRAAQHEAFAQQLSIAADAGKPAIIHAREADDDVAAILLAQPGVTAILHSFSSGLPLLDAALGAGHYASFSGMVTFRNWGRDDAIRLVPLDRLLIETDGPYLAPVPHRGQRNEPAWVAEVARRIGEVHRITAEAVADATDANARRLFGLGSA